MVKMVTGKILVLLILVAGSSFAYSKSESLFGQGVFPDDRKWQSFFRRKHLVEKKITSEKETSENNYQVCETNECKKVAEEFLSSINKSVNPCDDFYEFTCGAWSGKDIIPPSLPSWSRFMIFDNTVKHRIKGALEAPPARSDILPVRQAKKWYRSCMDTEGLEKRGLSSIESILMQNGGWPITIDEEEWDSEEHSWQNVERNYVRLRGSYAFFNIRALPVHRSAAYGHMMITLPKKTLGDQLPMSYRNYSGNDYNAYVQLVESAAQLFVEHNHANVSKERLSKEAKEIVEFEKELYELESPGYDETELLFSELEELYDNITEANSDPRAKIDLMTMVEELFDTVNIKVHPNATLYFADGLYIEELSKLLARTPARTIVNYIHWTFVGNMLEYTTEHVRNELLRFAWQQFGVKERRPRWLECVTEMKMTHAAAYVFVDKYFTNTTEHAALDMIKNIRNELREKIANSNWLDDESKIIAKDKLDSMKVLLGFPTWYNNRTALINYYKGITIGADYFENTLSFIRYENKRALKRYLYSDAPDEGWAIDPITVNALYGPEDNMLNLPAVDFQAPLFTRHLPDAVNYGIAGVIVGHEMGHGFDNDGIQFGKYGNETELSEKILKSYYQRAECFSDQYEEYYREVKASEAVTENSRSDPEFLAEITMGENIADTTGIQAVFQAFKKLNKEGSRLPGLEEYNPEQLFFMSFAAVWCKVETPQFEEKRKESFDPHSPAKLRVIGSVSNTKDFASVFNCPKGSEMNPINKCNIWEKSETSSKEKKPFMIRNDHPWETQWKN